LAIQPDPTLESAIRTIVDYPKPGISFRDITTLLGDARAFRRAVDQLVQPYAGLKIDQVAGIEARGFILGGAVAHQISAGFVPIRKKGKLPHETVRIAYSLEYGIDEMEMHKDAIEPGEKVIVVDDLIATGGTAEAAIKLSAIDRGRGGRGLLHYRFAGPARREKDRGAWGAGARADGV
jgi:adenine phosphoribosyltransferase